MNRMKPKRFLSLLLALVMSLSLSLGAPAFAMAEPVVAAIDGPGPDDGIMPLAATLYEDTNVNNTTGDHITTSFTSTPGNGQHIKVWYANRSAYKAYVMLFIEGQYEPAAMEEIAPNTHKGAAFWYDIPDTEPVTFHVRILAEISGPISGDMSVVQQTIKT